MKKELRSRNKNSGDKRKPESYTVASSKKHHKNRLIKKQSLHPHKKTGPKLDPTPSSSS